MPIAESSGNDIHAQIAQRLSRLAAELSIDQAELTKPPGTMTEAQVAPGRVALQAVTSAAGRLAAALNVRE